AGKREFWYDETLSLLFSSGQKNSYQLPENVPFALSDISTLLTIPAERGLGDAIENIKAVITSDLSEPHPPLLYLIGNMWMRLFGTSESAIRSSLVLMSLATLCMAYFLGRRILGTRGGLIFAALLALNPFFLSHSLNFRMYSPLLLWVSISTLCLLVLMRVDKSIEPVVETSVAVNSFVANSFVVGRQPKNWQRWLLRGGVAISLAAGLMTQYLFGYWFFALAALALFLDRKHWLQNGLTLGCGAALFMPWGIWGTLQQLANRQDVLERLSPSGNLLQTTLQHGQDLAQTLANYLLLGHLTTSMLPMDAPIKPAAIAIGCGAIGFVVMCVASLYRRRQYWVLVTCALLGLFPLLLALSVDIVANKNTLGFGWGRATIVVLPGCLLLIAAWLEKTTGRWREVLTAGILATYLAVNIGDFEGRDRQMFHAVNTALLADNGPTLVVMNSRAWGHVTRLAYYLDEAANPDVLATAPADVTAALAAALNQQSYARILWLQSNFPLWDAPETSAELNGLANGTEQLLRSRYRLAEQQSLRGTMNLDSFELSVYERPTLQSSAL
ncbi:MAG: glycosyltransferase family 39 protein, partial [Phormidesmis sp.]